jgi:nucleoside-diphosphate-sugar epimerase
MDQEECGASIIGPQDPILITGGTGFIGSRVIENLLERGFCNLRCIVRPSTEVDRIETMASRRGHSSRVEVIRGNLLSREDCARATKDVAIIIHLAAARGEKSFPDAFMNSVVTTRNLLEAVAEKTHLRRFVNISSFAVYSNRSKPRRDILDETCPVESRPDLRGDAYCFAKVKQDEIVKEYGEKFGIPYVIVRPGYVYGPGNEAITSRVGIGTFGVFLHLGGANTIPFTFVDNCVEAIVRAGLTKGVDGEVFNVVDDDLPTSRRFLRLYKRNVHSFRSIYLPHVVSYTLCYLWEAYASWSEGQLPPVYNRKSWHANWKKTRYSNDKLKKRLGWMPKVSTAAGLKHYFESCREKARHA